jgi:hypothetical protein
LFGVGPNKQSRSKAAVIALLTKHVAFSKNSSSLDFFAYFFYLRKKVCGEWGKAQKKEIS